MPTNKWFSYSDLAWTEHIIASPSDCADETGYYVKIIKENNFCYSGAKDGVEITVFENNYVPPEEPSTYEATLVYLIRQDGKLSIHTDRPTLGLFSQTEWLSVMEDAGLEVKQLRLEGVYDQFILGAGEYPMWIFAGLKTV